MCAEGHAPAGIYRCERCTPEYTRTVLAAPAAVLAGLFVAGYAYAFHREAIARLEELEPEDFIEICEDDSSSCESLGSKQVQEKLHERLHESWETQAAAG